MGAQHFKQMFTDALDCDRAALPVAMELIDTEFWRGVPFDGIMSAARRLVTIRACFSEQLKGMLLDGSVTVRALNDQGEIVLVRDPDVIDFDDTVLSAQQFFYLMMHIQ